MRRPSHHPPYAPLVTPRSDDRQSEIKLFTLWNHGAPPPFRTADDGPVETKSLCRATHNPDRWWVVTLTAMEMIRFAADPLTPLDRDPILRNPNVVPSTRLRARLGWGRTGQGHDVEVDIGSGVRLAIEGCEVDVKIAGPRGRMRETVKGDSRPLGEPGVGGIFTDTIISAHIVPSHGPPSARHPTLTQVISVPAGVANRSLVVPRFARRLTVVRSGSGALGPLSFRLSALGPSLRDVPLNPADPGATATVLIPQLATHITTGPADMVERVMTFQWELDL